MTAIDIKTAFAATRRETLYRDGRAMPAPANRRLDLARDNLARYEARRVAYDLARKATAQATPDAAQEAQAQERAALVALTRSRALVAFTPSPVANYLGTWQRESGHWYCENPGAFFRDVIRASDTGAIDHNGWFDNDHGESARDGSGLIWGIVAQLVGRNGRARFVAGYQVGDSCGAVFDMSQIFEGEGDDSEQAQRDCARLADSMAESCADKERDYKRAWQAGQEWRDLKEQENETRRETMELLAERRAARSLPFDSFPQIRESLCKTIRAQIEAIKESRATRESLWHDIPARLESAFCEGADLESAPA
mgnify:CR=1 FL=1